MRLARWLALVVISGGLSLVLAGRADIPRLWAYLGLFWGIGLATLLTLSPEFVKERLARRQKTADPVVLASIRLLAVAQVTVGILDVGRFHWSDTVPVALAAAGMATSAAAVWLIISSMRANRFFIPSVRIQSEKGHHLIDHGPYRLVRHPGYAGMAVLSPSTSLVLGSWLGFALGVAAASVFILRAWREDGFLKKNLGGYAEYAERTRFRVLPGVW